MANRIYLIGTADTKGDELRYLRSVIADSRAAVTLVDVGTRVPTTATDVSAHDVAALHPMGSEAVFGTDDRGTAVAAMGDAFANFITSRNDVRGILGIGGGGGTSIITAGMRALPIGVPKLMVSTLASGGSRPQGVKSDAKESRHFQ